MKFISNLHKQQNYKFKYYVTVVHTLIKIAHKFYIYKNNHLDTKKKKNIDTM
jgi:hypothetical protein